MPTYAYACDACGHRLEEFQSITAPPLKKCPACRKSKLQRLIGAGAGVIFKGSGFYQTDYKKSGGDNGGRSDKDSGTKEAGKKEDGGGTADATKSVGEASKPAAKTDGKDAGKVTPRGEP
jgi:putative FmdB family regulatory protein